MTKNSKKCFVIMVARVFPNKHPKAGIFTWFIDKIVSKIKKHTVRKNYALWKKRIDEVNKGNAYLSLREWQGRPYRSKQTELLRIEKAGIEKIDMIHYRLNSEEWSVIHRIEEQKTNFKLNDIANNDGLSRDDFVRWFFPEYKPYQFSGAIIHFTDFRYIK